MIDGSDSVRWSCCTRVLAGPSALVLTLALAAAGCAPEAPSSEAAPGVTSKVPEIARRQQKMQEMIKKAESKTKSSGTGKPH